MNDLLLSIAPPEFWSMAGFLLGAAGLLGEIAVVLVSDRQLLRKLLGLMFAAIIVAGYVIGRIGDGAIFESVKMRASIAEKELSKIKKPRTLSTQHAAAIAERLKPFSGQIFQVIPYWKNPESRSIGESIAQALLKAGWKIDQPKAFTTMVGVVTGVNVHVDKGIPPKARMAAEELVAALNASDVLTTLEENNVINPSDRINLNVGIKP